MASLGRIAAGVGISILLGVTLGLLMSRFKTIDKLLGSFIYFTYPVPKLALLPVVMLLAGIGEATKIIMIVLI
ncbi:ABC transporter permease, partial [Escherichia coli]